MPFSRRLDKNVMGQILSGILGSNEKGWDCVLWDKWMELETVMLREARQEVKGAPGWCRSCAEERELSIQV